MPSRTPVGLAAIVEYLKRKRGFDFTAYRPASIERRVRTRMAAVGVRRYPDYVDYLEVYPEEFEVLFNTILSKRTAFFRDAAAWDFLARCVIPQMLASKPKSVPVRVWSAGCATGEEAYSLAMLFAEAMGAKGYRERVRVYATDIDVAALAMARRAAYDEREIAGVPEQLLAKYFELADGHRAVRKELRRNVIFARHDFIQEAPISRLDLLACRNALMYFNAETQSRMLRRFHFALQDGGDLFVGRAESPRTGANRFAPIDCGSRIAVKVAHVKEQRAGASNERRGTVDRNARVRESALETVPMALLVVDSSGSLVVSNGRARLLFALSPADLGRPIHELDLGPRSAEIRSRIQQAFAGGPADPLRDMESHTAGVETKWLDVLVTPLSDNEKAISGVAIAAADVTVAKRLRRALLSSNQELEAAYDELKSTHEQQETASEELRSMIEELETTNEVLWFANQKLESINEDLRSGNAAHETSTGSSVRAV
ncbi:MAG TPA: CheR family methyltransferase [Gemmatimonadaceae bacterium]|nr:CheR family methyltransferase [Gemmatimonadaceae bacterium]